MTALQEAIDYTVLGWLKPELDEEMRRVREDVEAFIDDRADAAPIRNAVASLHRVGGSLRMIDLTAPVVVAEEMERLAQAIADGRLAEVDEACATLMRGTVVLPDYLERLQSGHRDIPIVLMPLLNDLRAARGEGRLSDVGQFIGQRDQPDDVSEDELEYARSSLSGHNRALLDTVAGALKEDLLRVKDKLDLFLRGNRSDRSLIEGEVGTLTSIGDTLAMLGLNSARVTVQKQRDMLQAVVAGEREADEDTLLDIASSLLFVDASLDDQVATIGSASDGSLQQGDIVSSESRRVVGVLAREAIANFSDARQAFVGFVETGWDHSQMTEVPRLLREVSGAMRMLEHDEAADYLRGIAYYTQRRLIEARRIPDSRELDTFADALASLEYYLEALRDGRGKRNEILAVTHQSLEKIGCWPLPDDVDALPASTSVQIPEAFDAVHAPSALEPAPAPVHGVAVPAPTPAPAAAPAAGVTPPLPETAGDAVVATPAPAPMASVDAVPLTGFDLSGSDIDDDIREIFLEEFSEEREHLATLLPQWQADPENMDHLLSIRRIFHTLKGSGRLVGARMLGEFSWKIENMLNRVRDGARQVSPAVIAVVKNAQDALPSFHDALAGLPASARVPAIEALADRIAEGEEAFLQSADAPAAVVVPVVVEEVAPIADAVVVAPVAPAPAEDAGVLVAVDPVLLEILDAEVDGHLATLQRWLADSATQPQASEALVRAIHTMNGAFAMTDVGAISDLITPAEAYSKRLLAARGAASPDGIAAIGELAEVIGDAVVTLKSAEPRIRAPLALQARLEALRDSLPDAPSPLLATLRPVDLVFPDEQAAEALPSVALPVDASLDAERAAAERAAIERAEADRIASERAAAERAEVERIAAERAEAERIEAERIAAERAEAERIAAERAETERLEAERIAAERAEADRVAAERAEAERLEAERVAAERAEADRVAAERAEAQRLEAERVEADRIAAERAEAERREAERLDAELSGVDDDAQRKLHRPTEEEIASWTVEDTRTPQERQSDQLRVAALREKEFRDFYAMEEARLITQRLRQRAEEASAMEALRAAGESTELDEVARIAKLREEEFQDLLQAENARLIEARLRSAVTEALPGASEEDIEAYRALTAAYAASATLVEDIDIDIDLDAVSDPVPGVELPGTASAATPAAAASPQPTAMAPWLAALLEHDRQGAVRPLDIAESDPELVAMFVEETNDLLDDSDPQLRQLRDPELAEASIVPLQRNLHTIKGGARMAGLVAIGDLGHAMESLLESAAEGRVRLDADDITLIERGFDRLHSMVALVEAGEDCDTPHMLVAAFDTRARGADPLAEMPVAEATAVRDDVVDAPSAVPSLSVPPAPPETVPVSDTSAVEMPVAAPVHVDAPMFVPGGVFAMEPGLSPLSAPIREPDEDDIETKPVQDQVRIRADLLDRLVNHAGEVAIYRSRLEQQLGAFRGAIREMEQTNLRLRDQLRRLELETEAQIIARYQREQDTADASFDPLELDRFSTLQQLTRALSESANDMSSLQDTLEELTRQYEILLTQQSRVSSELQEGLMRTRMVPFDAIAPRLRRLVRQTASETGKQANLELVGTHGELDRNVLERMAAPMEHLLRNAIAHGIESPADRRSAGKNDAGELRIRMGTEGSEVLLQVTDDGAGLNRAAIRRRAAQRGLIREDALLADDELDALILRPGFSTAENVSQLAGRGVGMDVVANEVQQLGGSLEISSQPGRGTSFLMRLPQKLAVTQAAFVRVGETVYAVPVASVQGVGRLPRPELATESPSYAYGGQDYPVYDLGRLLGAGPVQAEDQVQMPLLLVRSGELRAAVCVDEVIGSREIVVKPVGPQVASIPGVFGATVMGDGRVVIILDIPPMVRRHQIAPIVHSAEDAAAAAAQSSVPLVMVVDDSVTMRKVSGRVLERQGFEVMTAKDGVDALEVMNERVPDLMLLDIEMPRMDGYELATTMKADPRLRGIRIIMITSRTGEKHRERAFAIGVDRYLGKPYQEPELLRNVYELLGIEQKSREGEEGGNG